MIVIKTYSSNPPPPHSLPKNEVPSFVICIHVRKRFVAIVQSVEKIIFLRVANEVFYAVNCLPVKLKNTAPPRRWNAKKAE